MNFLNWGLNAIDTIFSTKESTDPDSHCPGSSNPAGHVKDPYGKWQPLCLSHLSVEDVEDIYIFWLLAASVVMIGGIMALIYRRIKKSSCPTPAEQPNQQIIQRLSGMPDMIIDIGRGIQHVSAKLDMITARQGIYRGRAV